MKIKFVGTRRCINAATRRHRWHTITMVMYCKFRPMIDWLGKVADLHSSAIIIDHAHPDHAWGLKEGVPCPVYAIKAIFMHCGSQIVEGDERILGALVRKFGKGHGVDTRIAYDGLEVMV